MVGGGDPPKMFICNKVAGRSSSFVRSFLQGLVGWGSLHNQHVVLRGGEWVTKICQLVAARGRAWTD